MAFSSQPSRLLLCFHRPPSSPHLSLVYFPAYLFQLFAPQGFRSPWSDHPHHPPLRSIYNPNAHVLPRVISHYHRLICFSKNANSWTYLFSDADAPLDLERCFPDWSGQVAISSTFHFVPRRVQILRNSLSSAPKKVIDIISIFAFRPDFTWFIVVGFSLFWTPQSDHV